MDTSRTAVVSAAFRPAQSNSLADKLARLNEALLYKTCSVEERQKGFYIPLPRDWWYAEFSHKYSEVQNAAIDMGMLEANTNESGSKRWCSGSTSAHPDAQAFCASYRLTDAFRTGSHKLQPLSRSPRQKARSGSLTPVAQMLAGKLRMFAVDASAATSAWDAIAATFLNRGFHRPSECQFGRFHSVLTGVSKEVRHTLHTGGKVANNETHMVYETEVTGVTRRSSSSSPPLVSFCSSSFSALDIRNCQPLCLAVLAMEQSSNKDVLHWSDLAQRGQVYEAIMDWLRLGNLPPYHITTPTTTYYMDPSKWDREQVKKQFMVAMFGDDTSLPVWKAIEANWPTVAAIAAKVKNRRYQALAHACQRLESSIVIQAACGSLCSRLPAIPLATVHDCLILPTDFVGAAQEALHHAFKMHGVVPSISVESLAA